MSITIIVISDLADEVDRTRGSIEGVDLEGAEILQRRSDDTMPWSGVTTEHVMLVRGGDLVDMAGVADVVGAMDSLPAVIGAHRVRATGRWEDVVCPTWTGVIRDESMAVDCSLELSSLVVRRDVLPHSLEPPPTHPGGDVSLFTFLARTVGLAASSAVVAEVRARAIHRFDVQAVLDRLRGTLLGSSGLSAAARSRIRRRALMLAYHDSDERICDSFSARAWWSPVVESGDAVEMMETITDLQWALARISAALRLVTGGLDMIAETAPADDYIDPRWSNNDLHVELMTANRLVAEREATVTRLLEEIGARDRHVAHLLDAVADRDRRLTELSSQLYAPSSPTADPPPLMASDRVAGDH